MTAVEAAEQEVKPLLCGGCGAAVALEDRDELSCHHCGAKVAVPAAHREALRAARQDAQTRSEAQRLYEELSRPISWWVRAVSFSFGGLVEAIWRWKGAGWFRYVVLFYVGLLNFFVVALLTLLPLIVPFLFYGYWTHNNTAETLTYAQADMRDLFMLVTSVLLLLGGAALGVYGRKSTVEVGSLQAALAARPPLHAGGPAVCRNCGGPLQVQPDDVGVRCLYCKADNLVALPARLLERFRSDARKAALQVEEAHGQMQAEARDRKRQVLWRVSALAAVLAVWFGGTWISVQTKRAATSMQDKYPPVWGAYTTEPRPVLRRASDPKQGWLRKVEPVAMPAGCQGAAPAYAPDTCAGGRCVTVLYVALRRGEQVRVRNLGSKPVQAELSWHRIAGLPQAINEPFGAVSGAANLQAGADAALPATWSSWHELRLTSPGGREEGPAGVCVEVRGAER